MSSESVPRVAVALVQRPGNAPLDVRSAPHPPGARVVLLLKTETGTISASQTGPEILSSGVNMSAQKSLFRMAGAASAMVLALFVSRPTVAADFSNYPQKPIKIIV